MAAKGHIDDIGVGLFSDLSISNHNGTLVPAGMTRAALDALFTTEDTAAPFVAAADTFVRIKNIRDFQAMGTPPNIVKVPVYGAKQSMQIQGQADAPSMEITLNYIPNDWSATALGAFLGDGLSRIFRFSLLTVDPGAGNYGYVTAGATGIGSVKNSYYYWAGKMEALLVKPSLTDATTATLTLSMSSDFYGAYTVLDV